MTFAPRSGAGSVVRSFTGVIATAVLLVTLALPAAAHEGPVQLARPSVSPSRGTTATTFTFSVTYRHRDGLPPRRVGVVIGRTPRAMVAAGDRSGNGVTFSFRTKLPAGEHRVLFVAVDGDGNGDTIRGGIVTVVPAKSVPKPKPTPERTPDKKPEAKPTPAPARTAAPKPRKTPAPPPPVAVVEPVPTPDPSPAAPKPTPAGPGDGRPTPPTTAAGGPPGGPGPDGPARGDPAAPDGPASDEATAGIPGSWGDLTRYFEALGLNPAGSPFLRLVPVMVWSAGGVALVMAFGFFGKRRRDGEPPEPDEVLSARAARGSGEAATATLVPEATPPALPVDAEMAMPRWRRPSLLQARKADPLRSVSAARLSFDQAGVAPIEGFERRLIRYMVVQLLDTPDEFRGAPIGSLAQGDEVQLLERAGTYWRVLCPDGQEGWIHRMTLGDTLGVAPSPSARETWATASLEAENVDEDVLLAFMTARRPSLTPRA